MSSPGSVLSGPLANNGSHLFALLSLLQTAVSEIVDEYANIGHAVPALDTSDMCGGPFDGPDKGSVRFMRAAQIIEGACAQLCASVVSPGAILFNFQGTSCLQVALSGKIADCLLDAPDGLHISELSRLSGIKAVKLGRVMRLLASKHIFREVDPDVFANNRISIKLLSSDPCSSFIGHVTEECFTSAPHLSKITSDSNCQSKTSFECAYGLPPFEYFQTSQGGRMFNRFNDAMIGLGDINGKSVVTKAYPWQLLVSSPGSPIIICDVGGSNGHVMLAFLRAFPEPEYNFKVVIQDLKAVCERGEELWNGEFPEAVQSAKVSFVPLDFFEEEPVKGADIYYIRQILHDWPDAECSTILSNIASAMRATPSKTSSTRLLINEIVIHPVSTSPPGTERAPLPLLANYGSGRQRSYLQDINMMNLFGDAKERSVSEFTELCGKVGLALVKVWDAGETSLLEFKLGNAAINKA